MTPWVYYVYILFDWMGVPFYVGKGTGNRDTVHERSSSSNRLKDEAIEHTWLIMGEIPKIRLYCVTEVEAFATEIMLIAALGRLDLGTGPLTNMTAGGDGLDSETARKIASKGALAANASMTPEQRSENGRKGGRARMASLTPEERAELGRNGLLVMNTLTPQQRSDRSRNINAAMTQEARSERSRKNGLARMATLTPAQRAEMGRKGGLATNAARTPEERSKAARKAGLASLVKRRTKG